MSFISNLNFAFKTVNSSKKVLHVFKNKEVCGILKKAWRVLALYIDNFLWGGQWKQYEQNDDPFQEGL